MKIEGAVRDRLIMVGAAAPGVLGVGFGFLLTHDFVQTMVIGAAMSAVSAVLHLTPPVTTARMRNLRRKYPKED